MNRILLLILCVAGLLSGFVHTRKNSAATKTTRNVVSVVFLALFVFLIVYALLKRLWLLFAVAVFLFLFAPGAGRTATLLAAGRAKEVGVLSWVLTLLFVGAVVYAAAFSDLLSRL